MHSVARERLVWSPPSAVFSNLARIGRNGYYADRLLWGVRSLLAPALVRGGAPGDASVAASCRVGDAVDHWTVAAFDPDRLFALACSMRGLGEARIAWTIEPRPAGRCLLTQVASLEPRHWLGSAYWAAALPPHLIVFDRLLRGIALESERSGTLPPAQRPTVGLRIVRRSIVVPRTLDEAFAFFADAGNLEAITPEWLHFTITTPTPIAMREGALIDYRIRLHGIPVRWHTRIDAWEPSVRFVDRQLRGPYRWWHHEHRFEPADGGTRVIDEVEYASPLRWISDPLIVRRDVERIFDFRSARLGELLGAR